MPAFLLDLALPDSLAGRINLALSKEGTMNEKKNNEPVDRVRIGRIEAAIWKNRGENGAWHSVTLSRSYKDKDGELQSTESISGTDLLLAAEVMRTAFQRCRELKS